MGANLAELEADIARLAGEAINPADSAQVARVLAKLGVPGVQRDCLGFVPLPPRTMEQLARAGHPFALALLAWREAKTGAAA